MRFVSATLLFASAAGHGLMNFPPSRVQNSMKTAGFCVGEHPEKVPQNGTCLWFNQGCQPGCDKCTGANCIWPQTCCSTAQGLMKPTLNDKNLRTFQNVLLTDWTRHNPWRSPGFAPIEDPCGIAAGWYKHGAIGNGGEPPVGIDVGTHGNDLPELQGVKTEWAAGSQQDVSWSIIANHGGGYAYRLCPKSEGLTEACFQKHHLQFVGDKSWIQYSDDKSNRTAIPAARVSEGTNPSGSQWTRNPIPSCSGPVGGALSTPGCSKPQFTPVPLADVIAGHPKFTKGIPGLYGFGTGRGNGPLGFSDEEREYWSKKFNFNIIDKVQIPADLPAGDYWLSFRWESEQTPQIWANCADITVTASPPIVL